MRSNKAVSDYPMMGGGGSMDRASQLVSRAQKVQKQEQIDEINMK